MQGRILWKEDEWKHSKDDKGLFSPSRDIVFLCYKVERLYCTPASSAGSKVDLLSRVGQLLSHKSILHIHVR